ncbi:InlB B-repeat-containing protein [Eubacteriaceae bacterium ES2]|nr:InlB B-repeat-containing protein [Eubacteriaceae bacterium ES2]
MTVDYPNGFENPGNTFKGWNTEADGSGTSYVPNDSITMAGDLTLYAIWTPTEEAMISSISPADSNTPLNGNMVITFNNDMDTTVTGTVTIDGIPLSGGAWSNGSRIYTIPYSGLAYYRSYIIDISGFKNTKYRTMKAASASFTTEATADLLSLAVNSGSLSPAFDPATAAYRWMLPALTESALPLRPLTPKPV